MRVIIVDDEPLAREGVELLLRQEPDAELVGVCRNGKEAITAINQLKPDLVLLDIKMPGLDGFGVIDHIGPENMPAVIFLTAYEEHALAAFEVNALDYLLKPVDADRFRLSMERARQDDLTTHRTNIHALLEQLQRPTAEERIVVRSAGHVHFLRPREISWIQANGDYVTIHAGSREHLIRQTLRQMEQRLKDSGFRRIHRSAIVNLEAIEELVATKSGDYQVILNSGAVLKLSRSYRDELYQALGG